MDNYDLEIDDRVQHPTFGQGTVTGISQKGREPIAEVTFNEQGKKQLAIRHAKLKKVTPDGLKRVYNNQRAFDDFLASSDHEDDHVHGHHWNIFFDDVAGFLKENLQQMVQQSQTATGWSDNHEPLYELPGGVPETVLLCHPGRRQGVKLVIKINREQGQNELMSFFPFVSEGTQHTLKLKKIYPWQGLAEAQIEAVVAETMEITFFDTDYVKNSAFYGPEYPYQFILAGFAYRCRIDEAEPLDLPEGSRKFFEEINKHDPNFEVPDQLETRGMGVFLPAEGGDRDDFEFRGPVKKVDELTMLDQRVYRIRTTVARFTIDDEDEDFDLDIYVTESALEDTIPEVGDDIAGILWLQGYLWYPGTHIPITKDKLR